MEHLELDISKYTIYDLKKVYNLKDNFEIATIEDKYETFHEKYSKYPDIIGFLTHAKDKLMLDYYANKKVEIENSVVQESLHTKISKQEIGNMFYNYNYINKLLVINSKFRKNFCNTESNDFIIELPYAFTNVLSMEFKAIEYTNSVYTINEKSGNNTFKLNNTLYTIPDGNYSNETLLECLNIVIPSNYNISFDNSTGKITIEECTNKPFILCFDDNKENLIDTFGYLLGFRKHLYIGKHVYTSESILDIQGIRCFNIYIDDYISSSTYDNIVTITKQDYFSSKILARIPNAADAFHIQYEDNSDRIEKIRYYYGPVNIKKLHIRLLDDNGKLLLNNNVDFTLLLKLRILS